MGEEKGKKKQITESRLEEALRSRLSYFYEHAKSLNMFSVRRMLEDDLGIEKFALDVHRRFIKQFVEKNLVENSGKSSDSTAEVKEEAAKDCEHDEKLKAPSSKADETGSTEESSNETKFGVAIVQSSIKKAILERADHFRANCKTLQLVSARRLLEGDLGLQINALDPFKKFIRREAVEVVAPAVGSESSFDSSKDISGESHRGSAPDASGSKEKSESRDKQKDWGQNSKGPGIKDEEDFPIMGLLGKKGDKVNNAQGIETSESTIKQAILDQAHYFRSNAKTLTVAGSRRFLEEKLGLAKNALDPFKKFICKQIDEVLDSPDVDVKNPNKPKQSKRPRSLETESKSSKKTKKDATKKSAKKIDSDDDSDSSDEPKSSIGSDEDRESSEDGGSRTSKGNADKKNVTTTPAHSKQVEHLKSIMKACGMGKLREPFPVVKMASYAQQPSSSRQYHSRMKGICKIYEKIHNDLRREHLDLLHKTPFGLLFKALYEKRICKKNRSDDVLDQIILSYNPKKKQFKIGAKYSKIYKSEIRLIFGIQDGKIRVDNNKCSRTQTAFTERNFPGVKNVTAKMIKDRIVKVVVKTDEDSVQDTVRLLCLLLFQNCFFTTTGQVLGWTYVKYVEDLSRLNSYDWTYIIHKNLIDGLDENSRSPQKVNGCTLALWYWFCERCKTIKPKEDEEVAIPDDKDMEYKGIPRATKWVSSDLNEVFKKSKLSQFKEDDFSRNKLKPTKAELKLMPNTPKDKQSEQTQRHENVEDDDDSCFEVPPPTKKCTNAAESSSRKKVKHTLKDKLSGKNKTQESEDDHDSAFRELSPKKKRANAVESSSSRKKGKHTAHNDDQENMKQEREIPQKTPEEEDDDSGIQENEIPQDPFQDIFQKMLNEYGNVNEKDQFLDSHEDNNNQAAMDTLEDLDPREEEMQRRELEIEILKSQIISLKSVNDQLLKKMKQCEDKEKASNELAERAMELVVSLKTRNELLEKDKGKKR